MKCWLKCRARYWSAGGTGHQAPTRSEVLLTFRCRSAPVPHNHQSPCRAAMAAPGDGVSYGRASCRRSVPDHARMRSSAGSRRRSMEGRRGCDEAIGRIGMEIEEGGRGHAHLAGHWPLAHPLVDEPPSPGFNRLHQPTPPTLVQHGDFPEGDR
jgi:hypothetical protein